MRVYGSGKVIPPIKTARNGDLLFMVRGNHSVIQVRASSAKKDAVHMALIDDKPLDISGELESFNGNTGIHHFVVMD